MKIKRYKNLKCSYLDLFKYFGNLDLMSAACFLIESICCYNDGIDKSLDTIFNARLLSGIQVAVYAVLHTLVPANIADSLNLRM